MTKATNPLIAGSSLDGDLAGARRRAPTLRSGAPRRDRSAATAGWARDAMLVDEHERGDQLALRVQKVHLGGRRDHVRDKVAHPRRQLVDQLYQALPIPAHFFITGGRVKRTRNSPS